MKRCWVVLMLWGCGADAEPSEVRRDASVLDAAVADAAVVDAEARDAALQVDAYVPIGDGGPPRSWRDVPPGPAASATQVCSRSWTFPPREDLPNDMGSRILAQGLVVDDDGNSYVSALLLGDADFGQGVLSVPLLTRATVVLKLGPGCELLWAKRIAPAGGNAWRKPKALGLRDDSNLSLFTESNEVDRSNGMLTVTRGSIDTLAIDRNDGHVLSEASYSTGVWTYTSEADANRHGHLLVTGLTDDAMPPDFGKGALTRAVGWDYLAVFGTDGKVVHNQTFGTPSANTVELFQRLGPTGDLLGYTRQDVAEYYGAPLAKGSLVKVDGSGRALWRHPFGPVATLSNVREDGTFAAGTTWKPEGNAVYAYSSEGAEQWSVPFTSKKGFFSMEKVAVAPRAGSVAVAGNTNFDLRIGNSESEPNLASTGALLHLWPGGALRWLAIQPAGEIALALEITKAEEVVLMGFIENGLLVRKYADPALAVD